MIRVKLTSILVNDQARARAFTTEKLGYIAISQRPRAGAGRARVAIAAALFVGVAPLALAQVKEPETPPAFDSARPAIGEWVGHVSWNAPIVTYAWRINPDDTFSSGRLGRGESGGGAWGSNGSHVTLKYADGVRYEGEVRGGVYTGTAYGGGGYVFGGFSMSRDIKHLEIPGDDGD